MDRGLLTFFDVKECGFYKLKRDKVDEHVEGSMSETLKLVCEWLKDRDVDETIPWDAESNGGREKIYCKSFFKNAFGDYLFVFWRQTSDDDGKLNGILAKSKCGSEANDSVKVKNEVKGQKVIYGQPLYYWFVPSMNLFASLKFSHSFADSSRVLEYLKKCIDLRIDHPRKKTHESTRFNPMLKRDITVKNIFFTSSCGKHQLKFKIDAEMRELSIKESSLDDLSKKITHIVVRDTISTKIKGQHSGVFKLWDKFASQDDTSRLTKHVEIITEVNLNTENLNEMLVTYNNENIIDGTWNNVGFRTQDSENTTKWFNRYIDRKYIYLDEKMRVESSYFGASYVLSVLTKHRGDLLLSALQPKNDIENKSIAKEG